MNKTAVIIGGGLGGLFTGAILSKEGVGVTVIEKNATVGGGLQSFTRFGEVFDTGMHVIGGMQQGGNIRRICDYLGITDKVHIKDVDPEKIDELYFAEDKRFYRIAQGRERFIDTLAETFPDQRANIVAYTDAIFGIVDELDLFYLRPASDYLSMHSEDFLMAADQFIAKYISDEHPVHRTVAISTIPATRQAPILINFFIRPLRLDPISVFIRIFAPFVPKRFRMLPSKFIKQFRRKAFTACKVYYFLPCIF